jgi:hypothetical protein
MGPFSQGGLDEALGLAVGPRAVRLGADVLEAELPAGAAEFERFGAGAVVGHHPTYGDAEAVVLADPVPADADWLRAVMMSEPDRTRVLETQGHLAKSRGEIDRGAMAGYWRSARCVLRQRLHEFLQACRIRPGTILIRSRYNS